MEKRIVDSFKEAEKIVGSKPGAAVMLYLSAEPAGTAKDISDTFSVPQAKIQKTLDWYHSVGILNKSEPKSKKDLPLFSLNDQNSGAILCKNMLTQALDPANPSSDSKKDEAAAGKLASYFSIPGRN